MSTVSPKLSGGALPVTEKVTVDGGLAAEVGVGGAALLPLANGIQLSFHSQSLPLLGRTVTVTSPTPEPLLLYTKHLKVTPDFQVVGIAHEAEAAIGALNLALASLTRAL